jgi:hydrogenase nickel incorporation protein HypA/HybF
MHEISLVNSILKTLELEFPEKVKDISIIYLRAGILSNVQPVLMQNAFAAVQETEAKYKDVKLEVEVLPIKIFCNTCELESEVEQYKFICKQCHQASKQVIQGEELLISKVEFKT